MRIDEWESRYRSGEHWEDRSITPTPLLVEAASKLAPGTALDIASGSGRNAIWLAEHGWNVTAIDGASTAIEVLNRRALERGLNIHTRVADLEGADVMLKAESFDFISKCYYLQRSLFPHVRDWLRPGGVAVVIVHLVKPPGEITYKQAAPAELRSFFADWEILHYFEGQPSDPSHKRAVAEIVARKPISRN